MAEFVMYENDPQGFLKSSVQLVEYKLTVDSVHGKAGSKIRVTPTAVEQIKKEEKILKRAFDLKKEGKFDGQ